MEKETNELRFAVESLWKRLDVPTEERQKVLEKVESFRLEDIQVVSNAASGHSANPVKVENVTAHA